MPQYRFKLHFVPYRFIYSLYYVSFCYKVPGDVVMVIDEKEDDRFVRKGADLIYKASIELSLALCGGKFAITHLDKRILVITILPGEVIRPGEMKMIAHEGMPIYKNPDSRGNLFIQFDIVFPPANWLPASDLASLEKLLPAKKPLPSTSGKVVDECVLENVDPSRMAGSNRASAGRMDVDDDEDHGQPGVQCAQQ